MKALVSILTLLMSLYGLAGTSLGGIVVFDRAAGSGSAVTLKAQTRGKIFAKGGERVEFLLDSSSIGRTLSGGDGYAYLEYVPKKSGRRIITVKAMDEQAEGVLLVVKHGGSAVLIDVAGSIAEHPLTLKPGEGSQDAIREISKKFPIVYLATGIRGEHFIREWLEDNGYPRSAVLPWNNGKVFDEITSYGIKLKAVIGSAAVIESAAKYKTLGISFEETEKAERVKSWEEIPLLLRQK